MYLLAQIDTSTIPKVGTGGDSTPIRTILQIAFSILGALSLLFVTVGGLRFVLSRGEPQGINQARNTIIYALIGLVVAISAYSIVTFVVGEI